jgi:hypothetical protein
MPTGCSSVTLKRPKDLWTILFTHRWFAFVRLETAPARGLMKLVEASRAVPARICRSNPTSPDPGRLGESGLERV